MHILMNRLLGILNDKDIDSTEHHIAEIMASHMAELPGYSINDIASLCTVSKSTVSKFVRNMGFEDYTDFKLETIRQREAEVYNLGNNISITDYMLKEGVESYLSILKRDIDQLYETLDMNKIHQLAKDLDNYKKVAAFGCIYSETAAIDFQYKLSFYRKLIHTSIYDTKQEEYIRQAGEDTLLIIFSNSGHYINQYQLHEGAPKKNLFDNTKAKTVLITANSKMEADPRIAYTIVIPYSSNVQNHPLLYQLLTELIAMHYRQYITKNSV